MCFLSLDPPTLQRAECGTCFLFKSEIHNAEGRLVNNDAIVKPGQEVSFHSGSKGLENATESVVINRLVREEVVVGLEVRKVIDRQSR